jgi:hypothetical protein
MKIKLGNIVFLAVSTGVGFLHCGSALETSITDGSDEVCAYLS